MLAFSGDTEWVETLIPTAAGSICSSASAYAFEKPRRFHMAWSGRDPGEHRPARCQAHPAHPHERRMLARREEARGPGILIAEDGMTIGI